MTRKRRLRPILYLDTNIILDYIRNRNSDSVALLEIIRKRRLKSWTSYYALLELTDKELENKWIWKRIQKGETFEDVLRTRYPRKLLRDEMRAVYDEIIEKFMEDFLESDIIFLNIPNSDDWDSILDLMFQTNISVGDAIHVIAALSSNCNVFVTRDSHLREVIKEIKPKDSLFVAVDPKSIDEVLDKSGIMPIFEHKRIKK